ncbi:MAG: flagellar assembly protein FliH [Gammaproteobacteria bacterium]|nr:flagellar assembly protein FliH [Gammaproteobacteria bacterium]
MRKSKVHPKDSVDFKVWEFNFIGDEAEVAADDIAAAIPTADELAQLHEQARQEGAEQGFQQGLQQGMEQGHAQGLEQGYQEGLQKGLQDGLSQGQEHVQALAERWESLVNALSRPLLELDVQVEEQLAQLAMAVARQVVRREIKADPNQIIGVVRKTVNVLPISARNVRVYLHPEDAAIVREGMALEGAGNGDERRWIVVEDPALTPGGCNIETEQSRIDATVEARLAAVIAQVMGGERNEDKAEPAAEPEGGVESA